MSCFWCFIRRVLLRTGDRINPHLCFFCWLGDALIGVKMICVDWTSFIISIPLEEKDPSRLDLMPHCATYRLLFPSGRIGVPKGDSTWLRLRRSYCFMRLNMASAIGLHKRRNTNSTLCFASFPAGKQGDRFHLLLLLQRRCPPHRSACPKLNSNALSH